MKKILGGILIAIPFVWVLIEGGRKFGWEHFVEGGAKFIAVLLCLGLGVYLIFSDFSDTE